ncbi:MAG: hypothetical protein HY460_02165 [Parcubacteria group bacterium]|nr:hypothetical protein [Parcubacteria group bacterium]
MIKIFRGPPEEQPKDFADRYYVATYFLRSKTTLRDAAWNLAIGQSIGNPHERSEFETDELFERHSCLVLEDEKRLLGLTEGIVDIAFPEANINFTTDGISQLLVQTMGGQCDIDVIQGCELLDIRLTPAMRSCLVGPVIGLKEMKAHCGVGEDKILFGGIVKPKVGLSPQRHLDLVKQLIDGGCNFIKEDEVLSDPAHCPIKERVPLVMNYIRKSGAKVFYCVSIHADPAHILKRVQQVADLGGNGIHVNFHCGLGVYKSIRELNLPLLLHFQKSGDKVLNTGPYHVSEQLIFKLAGMSGCSTLHVGMIGGYLNDDTERTKKIMSDLNAINAVPALSCGMHPGLVDYIKDIVGHANWMANVGGALTSHPSGTLAGVRAMRQAIDGNYGVEYEEAIKKWGKA